jgi:ABC-type molybdate transport system substrate-binding protein
VELALIGIGGPFPAALQHEIIFATGVAANTKNAEAAKAFITYL